MGWREWPSCAQSPPFHTNGCTLLPAEVNNGGDLAGIMLSVLLRPKRNSCLINSTKRRVLAICDGDFNEEDPGYEKSRSVSEVARCLGLAFTSASGARRQSAKFCRYG